MSGIYTIGSSSTAASRKFSVISMGFKEFSAGIWDPIINTTNKSTHKNNKRDTVDEKYTVRRVNKLRGSSHSNTHRFNFPSTNESLSKLKHRIQQFTNKPNINELYLYNFNKSIDDGLKFLDIFPTEFPLPDAHCAEDGEIVLEWSFINKSVVLSITGDGYYGYTFLQDGKYVAGMNDANVDDLIPQELYEYFEPKHD